MERGETCEEMFLRGEGCRGGPTEAGPAHAGRGSGDCNADSRSHLLSRPEYEGGRGR